MRSQVIEKAPQPVSKEAPMSGKPDKSYYTTAIIGGNAAGPATGWEVIQPNHHNKPSALVSAQEAVNTTWANYLWHIDAGADQGTLEALWEAFDQAKRECDQQYDAWQAELAGEPYDLIPF